MSLHSNRTPPHTHIHAPMHSLTGKSQYSGFTKSLTGRGFSNSKSAAAAGSSVTVAQLPVNIPHSKLADHAHNGAVVHTNPSTGEMETVRVLDAGKLVKTHAANGSLISGDLTTSELPSNIPHSKLAALTPSKVAKTNSSGALTSGDLTTSDLPSNIPLAKLQTGGLATNSFVKTDASSAIVAGPIALSDLPAGVFHSGVPAGSIPAGKIHFDGTPTHGSALVYVDSGAGAHQQGSFKTGKLSIQQLESESVLVNGKFLKTHPSSGKVYTGTIVAGDLPANIPLSKLDQSTAAQALTVTGVLRPASGIDLTATTGNVINGTDNATDYITCGRARMGVSAHAGYGTYAFFGHRSYAGTARHYAMLTNGTDTYLNGTTSISLLVDGYVKLKCDGTHVDVAGSLRPAAGVDLSASSGNVMGDGATNATNYITVGRARMGVGTHGPFGAYAFFGHRSHTGQFDYAVLTKGVDTHLNSTSSTHISVNGVTQLLCNGTNLSFQGTIIHSSDERIKAAVETPDPTDMWNALKTVGIRTYTKPYTADPAARRLGVVANELEAVGSSFLSGAVHTQPGTTRVAKGVEFEDLKSVEYEQLYRMTLAVVQQLQTRVEALEAAAGQ